VLTQWALWRVMCIISGEGVTSVKYCIDSYQILLSTIKIIQYTSRVALPGRTLPSTIDLLSLRVTEKYVNRTMYYFAVEQNFLKVLILKSVNELCRSIACIGLYLGHAVIGTYYDSVVHFRGLC